LKGCVPNVQGVEEQSSKLPHCCSLFEPEIYGQKKKNHIP